MENKSRILCLLDILHKYSDEEHPLSTNDLENYLKEEYGLSVHRITLKNDIKVLVSMGHDIIETRSSQNMYFLGERVFELPELQLLIDAVESSKFITKQKSKTLISKIHMFASQYQNNKLNREHYVIDNVKPTNEHIYYIVDKINEAIDSKKQISFQYYDYTIDKEKILKNDGETYILSPYYLIWNGDYYYVLGYSSKREKVISFRVDRIASIPQILNESIISMPEDFDLNDYVKTIFNMYGGEKKYIKLKCHKSLMKVIIDKFGEDVETQYYDEEYFMVHTEVLVSPTFFGWVFSFNGEIEIVSPDDIIEQYQQLIKEAYQRFQ